MPLCILFKTQKATGFSSRKCFRPHFPGRPVRFFRLSFFCRLVVFRRSPYLRSCRFFRFRVYTYALFRRFFFRHRPPSFASLLLPKNTVQNVPAPAGNFRSQKGTLTQNRGYSYADILPHGTAKLLKGTRRPDKATILSASRKQV